MKTSEITPEFIEAWSFSGLRRAVEEKVGVLMERVILYETVIILLLCTFLPQEYHSFHKDSRS